MKPKAALLLPVLLLSLVVVAAGPKTSKAVEKARKFHFTYSATVKNLPPGAGLVRVWIPVASSDQNQTVALTKASGSVPTRITREAEYGNRMMFAEIRAPQSSSLEFVLEYEVERREYSKGDFQQLLRYNREPVRAPVTLTRFLAPDRLVPVDGKMKELSEENASGKQGPVEKARSIYEYLFRTMRYDKSGTGWGRGDSVWACDAKRGNCTDFHSPFISMVRAQRIPARFDIGFPLPEGAPEGEIPGYHCWAEFYVRGAGWIPVDISEAWKNPAKHDYFFGSLDVNRVQLTTGRDFTLAPPQNGPPLNYFVYPYVEVDGRPHEAVDKRFSFRETEPTRVAAGQ